MRQPNWKRWEVILLVDMFFRLEGHPEKIVDECEKLSRLLRRSNLDMALESKTYRNVKGIKMKYQNIRHLVEGKGLSAHSQLDVLIVDLYHNDVDSFKEELNAIIECINECEY